MGRTLSTFNMELRAEEARFKHFRACLPPQDKYHFDLLFSLVKQHVAALSMADHPLPFQTVLMGMIFVNQKRIAELEAALPAGSAH